MNQSNPSPRIFNKLVRDRIPEIIASRWETAMTHVAESQEYYARLCDKLLEEVGEFLEQKNIDEELADVLEVIYAICEFKNIDREALEVLRQKKAAERGGFTKRIVLELTR